MKITKIGLLNFWLYDEEEFDFYDGKLILRGTNGSGKSVTMQSFIPLILDGNKSPDRLDPFGSKERKIEDYIIGNSETIQKEEAISYLYMEVKKDNNYITIGLGFKGRKGKPVESWGFALKDGKRIGKDFYLYKDPANKVPLSKNELKSRLGTINEFTDTTKEYKSMVNRLLFGFPNLDTYDEFIKLLLQLRSNKLSKDYKPTNLVNVLNTVLQPLTEEDLRPLSEAIEQMNKTKEKIETLEKNTKSLKEFLKLYKNYNEVVLLTKARNYQKTNKEYKNLKEDIKRCEKEFNNLKQDLDNSIKRKLKVIESIDINNETKKQLDNQDLKQKIENLNKINKDINNLEIKIKELKTKLDSDEQDKLNLKNDIAKTENEIYKIKKEIDNKAIDLKDLANDIYFDEITFFIDDLLENKTTSFETILKQLNNYKDKVSQVTNLLDEEQKILIESETTRVEYEKLTKQFKNLEQDINNQETNLKESIMSWEEQFINNLNNNNYLKLDNETKKSIFDLMNSYTIKNFEKVKDVLNNYANMLIDDINKEILTLELKKSLKQKEMIDLKKEYDLLKNKKDLEIPNTDENIDKILDENNIKHISLYKCLEFKQNIEEKVKNKIENILLNLNMLNAKIIAEEDLNKLDKLNINLLYLTKTKEKKNNLLKYFDVVGPNKNYIMDILKCISTDTTDLIAINENGISKIDALNFIADKNYQQTYIGYIKRLNLRKEQLEKLSDQINLLNIEIKNIDNLIDNDTNKIIIIKKETVLPDNNIINQILDRIHELNISLSWNDKKQKELENIIFEIDNKLKEIKRNIEENKKGLYIPLNLKIYKEVLLSINVTKDLIQDVHNLYNNYINKLEINESYKTRLEDNINNIDYLEAELNEKSHDLNINIENKNTIEKLLESKEYQDQKEKLLNIEIELDELNKEKDSLIDKIGFLTSDIQNKEINLNNLINDLNILDKKLKVYEEIFVREYKLNYVYQEELIDVDNMANKIIKDGSNKKEISVKEALNNIYSSFNQYSLELNDYSLKYNFIFSDYEKTTEEINKIYDDNTRIDITAMYQGIKLNIIKLNETLNDVILENKDLISQQDRYLFEEILLNTVGEKIRNRIKSSNEWVNKINNIMATMQENSALSFKLVWKSISAIDDNEIDTKEIVQILQMSPDLLDDKYKEKLTNHFRSKIKKAEELYSDSYISFYKIIEEVLDYRSWFTFQLLYQRKGMPLKELTDKTFSKFSGGERAKSMYIPLFASVYAKLNSAYENSLRVIALDEAFAGVDEDNIREMFGILKYLNLDFIINSQVLWGDYDTINDLSICELIRPYNSNIVTVERYRWNGKYKEIIQNREELNEGIY